MFEIESRKRLTSKTVQPDMVVQRPDSDTFDVIEFKQCNISSSSQSEQIATYKKMASVIALNSATDSEYNGLWIRFPDDIYYHKSLRIGKSLDEFQPYFLKGEATIDDFFPRSPAFLMANFPNRIDQIIDLYRNEPSVYSVKNKIFDADKKEKEEHNKKSGPPVSKEDLAFLEAWKKVSTLVVPLSENEAMKHYHMTFDHDTTEVYRERTKNYK